jgi:type IX secretion system PorP/SprF family membrane protein
MKHHKNKILNNIMNLRMIIVISSFFILHYSSAQLPLLNNYTFNPSSYNVAYTGANQSGEFFANYRKQWLSMPNSPWYMQATMGVPIRNDKKLAIGFNILHQQAFVLSNTSALANIAYHLPLGKEEDKHYLSGGMGFGMQLQSLNLQNATPYTMDDPNYTSSVN